MFNNADRLNWVLQCFPVQSMSISNFVYSDTDEEKISDG
jgi:hypothetical protein